MAHTAPSAALTHPTQGHQPGSSRSPQDIARLPSRSRTDSLGTDMSRGGGREAPRDLSLAERRALGGASGAEWREVPAEVDGWGVAAEERGSAAAECGEGEGRGASPALDDAPALSCVRAVLGTEPSVAEGKLAEPLLDRLLAACEEWRPCGVALRPCGATRKSNTRGL